MFRGRRQPPDPEERRRERHRLRYPFDGHPQAIVARRPQVDRDVDGDVQERDEEGEARRLFFGSRADDVQGRRAHQEVRVALVVGADRDDPRLRIGEQRISAKSAELHGVIAFGLPKTPGGRFTETLSAASGWPGSASVKVAVRSGWPPASVLVVLVSNDSIASEAWAEAEATSTMARAIRQPTTRPGGGPCVSHAGHLASYAETVSLSIEYSDA